MRNIYIVVLSSFMLSNTAFASRITTDPLASNGDYVISTSIKQSQVKHFKVVVKTQLESFYIEMKNYADASALVADLRKNTTTHCKVASKLRTKTLTECKLVEVKFND